MFIRLSSSKPTMYYPLIEIFQNYTVDRKPKCNSPACIFEDFRHTSTAIRISHWTILNMKSSLFLVITPSSLMKVNRCFGRKYRLSLQNRRTNQARKQYDASSKQRTSLLATAVIASSPKMLNVILV
jgi:hypothetical protein